ncbi:MAG: hypothetical protein KDD34_03210 [Bdellovibrionales bacterium]|nr:hypothetical protein [Bdellovibrionales bacterium]
MLGGFAHGEETQSSDEGQSSLKMEDLQQGPSNKVIEVSNSKVKAMTGSESKFSLQGEFNYSGASIKKPFGNERPNPEHNLVAPETELEGNLGVAYRINRSTTLGVGSGLTFVAPTNEGLNKAEVTTPYMKLAKTYKAFGAEQVTTAKFRYYTGRDRDVGRDTAYSLLHYLAYQVGQSRWTVGADLGATYWTHLSDAKKGDYEYGWGATPFVEYKINDRFALTNSITFGGTHYQGTRADKLRSDQIYGDLGVNISLMEGVVVTPQIEYYTADLKPETSTVGVAAIISLL